MFRFSIRELMLVMLVAGVGVAWFVEHRRAQAAVIEAKEAKKESKSLAGHAEYLRKEIGRMEQEVGSYGLGFCWGPNSMGPQLYRREGKQASPRIPLEGISSNSPR